MHESRAPSRPERPPLDHETASMLRALLLCELIEQIDLAASTSAVRTGPPRTRALQQMMEIRSALDRLDDGSYGTCDDCRRPVPLRELEALPTRRRCAGCTPADIPRAMRSNARRRPGST